jgi:FkbM family methyltransferase
MVFAGIKVPLRKIPLTSVDALKCGIYEDVELSYIEKYLPRGSFVVELGASIGIISCHILKKDPQRLVSFEALENWAKLANEIIKLNFGKLDSFKLVQCAVGEVGQSEVIFNTSSEDNLGGHVVSVRTATSISVPAMSLFDINKIYDVPQGAWLIMDIEGMEWDIAKNQGDALRRYQGVIVECHKTMDDEIIITPPRIVNEITLCGFTLIEKADHGTHIVAVFKRTAIRHP